MEERCMTLLFHIPPETALQFGGLNQLFHLGGTSMQIQPFSNNQSNQAEPVVAFWLVTSRLDSVSHDAEWMRETIITGLDSKRIKLKWRPQTDGDKFKF